MANSAGPGIFVFGLLFALGYRRMTTQPVPPPGRGRGSVPPPAPGTPATGSSSSGQPYVATPTEYAQGKLSTMRARALGQLGVYLGQMQSTVFGPCPLELGVGATAMATGPTEDVPSAALGHEIGYFNTPLATWRRLRTSDLVRELLGGRDAILPDGTAWQTALEDQTAIGLADLLGGQRAVGQSLPTLAAITPGSAWGWWLACSAWSAGAAGTASHLRPHATALAAVPSSQRVGAYLSRLLTDVSAGRLADAPALSHGNPAYTALRTCQKLWCARLLAQSLVGSPAELDGWWDQLPTLSEGEEALLVRGARGVRA